MRSENLSRYYCVKSQATGIPIRTAIINSEKNLMRVILNPRWIKIILIKNTCKRFNLRYTLSHLNSMNGRIESYFCDNVLILPCKFYPCYKPENPLRIFLKLITL